VTVHILNLWRTAFWHCRRTRKQVTGVWTLTSGAKLAADGTKPVPWSAGNLILDPRVGRMSFLVFARDRKSEGAPDLQPANWHPSRRPSTAGSICARFLLGCIGAISPTYVTVEQQPLGGVFVMSTARG
jgi:hypothetical protein